MGNVIIFDATGHVTSVDKTWDLMKELDGRLRMIL